MNELILKEFDSPSIYGEDCRYDDSFLLIEQEIDKDYSVTQEGGTNWNYVLKNSEELLSTQSKDLKLASWWLYANWKEQSWDGLEYGLNTYIHLLEKYSDGLFPKSKKAKINIISWLEESLINNILGNKSCKISINNASNLLDLYNKLDFLIKSVFNTEVNYFRKIINFLKPIIEEENKLIQKQEQEKIQELETKKNEEIPKKVEEKKIIPLQEDISEINSDAEAIKVLRTFKKNASLLTNYYRKNDISDLKALRITRLLSWLDTEGLPYADGKKTFLHPPSELELDEVENLYKNKEYEDAFYLAEEILEVSPFWIDGHFYIFNILEKTKNFDAAKEIKNTLSSFVKTNEGILDFTFTDDTAFASNRTKKWIEEELVSSNKQEIIHNTEKESENILEDIYELANDNKLKDAMYLLQQKHNTAFSIEEKFNWRLHHAQLAVEFDKKDIALALLEELEKDIKKYHLDEWNPKLASKVYILLLTSFTNIDIHSDKIDLIYKNLCKTDVNSAFEIKIN